MYEDCPRDKYGAILVKCGNKLLPKNCCPVCGKEFYEVKDINICEKLSGHDEQTFTPEELITEEDDYAWVL